MLSTFEHRCFDLGDNNMVFTPQTDLAILNYIANYIIRTGKVNKDFVDSHVNFRKGTTDIGYGLRPAVITAYERTAIGGGDEDASADEAEPGSLTAAAEPDESEQATEQWLRRIPDDPGGLLRRKFYYQYRERGAAPGETEEEQSW